MAGISPVLERALTFTDVATPILPSGHPLP
jgi:hypothetical protein